METRSLLAFRRTDTRLLFMMLGALAACGGDDDNKTADSGTGGAVDASADTTTSRPDGATADTGGSGGRGGGAPDAPPSTSDAPVRDTGVIDRDGTSAETTMPPPMSDAQGDAPADATPDAGTPDSGHDAGRGDSSLPDASTIDVTIDAPGPTIDAPSGCNLCAAYGPAEQAGRITSSALNALSGIAASRRNAGVIYVHNDRNVAQFFAVSEPGALLGTFNVTGAAVEDIEDVAVAHCPAGNCVYLADIGGNINPRTQFAVVRAPEPEVRVDMPGGTMSLAGERLVFAYPDGANHNAESMFIDPNSDTIYVITKVAAGTPSAVYRVAATFGGGTLTAEKVADLTVPKSTDREASGASVHPCAPAFLLRTYNTLYEFRAAPGAALEAAFTATPTVVPVATETQSEGVTYRSDGRGYFTTTEGSQPAINRVTCP
jgi:hypothetical protein